jgi:lipopolysaccharide/colanic/teichoic acid biosynthesis glycosyltransferase
LRQGVSVKAEIPRRDWATHAEITRSLVVKRLLDIVLSAACIILLAPTALVIAAAIKLESDGSVLYRCERCGLNGRTFGMLKFRKMHNGARGLRLTLDSDSRFTRVGRVLAKTKLDELPQFWNVLRGHMSLVGPRPEDPLFVLAYTDAFADVFSVRPGITGLSQLAFVRESLLLGTADVETRYLEWLLPSKMAIDRLYVARRTLWLDLTILVWTVRAVLLKNQVSVHRRTAVLKVRRRVTVEAQP